MKIKLGFLASGGGTSVEALVNTIRSGSLEGFEPGIVFCNKARGNAGIYERADRLGLLVYHSQDTKEQLEAFKKRGVNMVLGLGYLKKVGEEMLDHFGNRIWNIHPALLPKHRGKGMFGLRVHKAVIDAGDKETGATVHIMDPIYDNGNVLSQVRIPVFPGETPQSLQQRVLPFEYALMATTLRLYRDNLLPNCRRTD